MAIECTHCGVKLADKAVFCHWCKTPVPRVIEQDPTKRLRWLKLWSYVFLPLFCVLFGLLAVQNQMPWLWASLAALFSAVTALGLHQHKRWGWTLNWAMVTAVGLTLAGVLAFDDSGRFVNKLFLTVPMMGFLWFWPNYVYWRKRSVLFT